MAKRKATEGMSIHIGISEKGRALIAGGLAGREAVARTARSIFPLADKAGDEPTADLLTQRLTVHEPSAWMPRPLLEA